MKVETITPELAAHYLKRNVDNYRKISKAKVQMYASEMKAGHWQLNGEGIMFDQTGKLKNGQHRLAAVIMAGIPIAMTVVTGVSDDVTIYDSGMVRSTSQIAQASGCGDITPLECAVGTAVVSRFSKATKGMVIEWLQEHAAEINRAYRISGANSRKYLSSRVGCVLATYLILRTGEAKSFELETFFKIFNTGNIVGCEGYEPSSALVARRIFEDRYKGVANSSRTLKEQTEIMLLALQDFQKGKTRQMNYQLKEPLKCLELVDKIRKEDGLSE